MVELRRLVAVLLVGGLALAGCGGEAAEEGDDEVVPDTIVIEEEGDLEEAVEETGEAVGEGAEAVGEGVEEVGEAVEDAVD